MQQRATLVASNSSLGTVLDASKESQHAGQVIVADGTPEAAARLERVLTVDPGMGVARHVDAGYPEAIKFAKEHEVKIPMLKS